MKPSIATLALSALVAIASLSQAHAQTHASRVNVPFAFDCAGQHFAPGTYQLDGRLDLSTITIRDSKTACTVLFDADYGQKIAGVSYVTFRKYGNRYFLAAYRPSNSGITMEVPASKKERIVARDFALNQPEPGRVQLALNDSGPIR
jgi:hypothetical protein